MIDKSGFKQRPYKSGRAKVKNGKAFHRARKATKRLARRRELAQWNATHPNDLTLAQMHHPQMRARFEQATA